MNWFWVVLTFHYYWDSEKPSALFYFWQSGGFRPLFPYGRTVILVALLSEIGESDTEGEGFVHQISKVPSLRFRVELRRPVHIEKTVGKRWRK